MFAIFRTLRPLIDISCLLYLGHYAHFEASIPDAGDVHAMRSGLVDWGTDHNCLTLWYHMYGVDTGNFTIIVEDTVTMER